ncbi:MAG: decaprenyl-phosphate phosphoribosyltransferase [Actinobacteria bacterium]|nr:decaprenyl-phosphate phosphoribosyltransferase [Actinomycetota bacterium]
MKTIYYIFASMRPKQWTKNLIIFSAPLFSGTIFNTTVFFKSFLGFLLLCLLSGSVYILNDIVDYHKDRNHPKKKLRPIASEKLSKPVALLSFFLIAGTSFVVAYWLGILFFICVAAYFILQLGYSFWLKNIVIIDVFSIAFGFLMRALSGVYLLNLSLSPWLFICAFLLALFLGFGKRRHELLLDKDSSSYRPVLKEYSKELLDSLIVIVASATVVSYSLYSFFSETAEKHQGLMWSIPFVIYGLFRYLYLVYSKNLGGNPEEILIHDIPLILDIVAWIFIVGFIILTS